MPELIRWVLYYFERAAIRVFSIYRWIVFVLPIEKDTECPLGAPHVDDGYIVRESSYSDIDDILKLYPKEFYQYMPSRKRSELVRSRFNSKYIGFVLLDKSGDIVGGTWALPVKSDLINSNGKSCFELVNTFIIPSKRGSGLGSYMRSSAIKKMAARGYTHVISYVWRSRKASINMNLSTGSRIAGEKMRINVLGFNRTYINRFVDLRGLVFLPHIILVGYDAERLKYVVSYLRRFGFTVKVVLANCSDIDSTTLSFFDQSENSVLILDPLIGEKSGQVADSIDERFCILNKLHAEFSFDDLIEEVKMESVKPVSYIFSVYGERVPVIDLS
ncbi:GNAT family N-acetyltransferase [Marinobacter sp. BW6]|uniref:GNAT family N-acetyltransferase n=1 Tax=Marinobacter sp. BW6 TaxID=2592624 RepID=UPI0011DEABAF|nr:GNAT family N-acetyltransferase [Marinobacter sp. BW6]TYC62720.1 GNAT family N-acetyltransferase [Marinobacter sp. BW6]